MLRFGILLSLCLCVWWEISLFFLLIPHLSSFIFTPSPSATDEPGQLKIYLPKKLLECLPKCSSLPKERHRWNTNEVRHTQNMRDSEMNSVLGFFCFVFFLLFFFAGDSSPANVTLSDEEEVNKDKGILSLWDPKTVTRGNKKTTWAHSQNPTDSTFHLAHCCLFHFVIQTNSGLRRRKQGLMGLKL